MDKSIESRRLHALGMLEERTAALRKAVAVKDGAFPKPGDVEAYERIAAWLGTWREETARSIDEDVSEQEASKFLERQLQGEDDVSAVLEYVDWAMGYLDGLTSGIKGNPQHYFVSGTGKKQPPRSRTPAPESQAASRNTTQSGKAVYIMHGADETNALRLHKMLKDWGLDAQFLIDDPSAAHTLVQMMDGSAPRASFVFVILTRDDKVTEPGGRSYMQPRPNPLIELGYYLAKLGQDRVAMLCQEDILANIPTNLSGIKLGTFIKSVDELVGFIQKELAAVGIGPLAT